MTTAKEIQKILHKHRKQLNRYLSEVKECQKGRLTKKKASQMSYSYTRANEELAICDVLEEIVKKRVTE